MSSNCGGVPYYVIKAAMDGRKESDEFAVCRSDGDYQYARTVDEAEQLKREMLAASKALGGRIHRVAIVELTEAASDE